MFELEIADGLARLILDRPARRNAIPAVEWERLAARIDEAKDARTLVVAGAGGAFCAGADLADFPMAPDAAARFRRAMRSALDRLQSLAIPTIAWVDGACYGAGVALAMACDLRLATAVAQFAITPAKIGISYPQEDVHRLVELVGPGQAARLLYTAGSIDAAKARRIGLVDCVVSAEEAEGTIASILANADDSLATLKHAIRLAVRGVREDAAQDERFDALLGGAELARRLEARRRT
ncbi:enoyl-CoA hydratase/isomerase family protein [Sphingosinicella sp. LHD-64]|uniref:enoyl-CoA hydratase/isomerase family protein n=1 Tax=Sphingosinicella sp. LHD-64 TaxID=3072139 RepID=UPI00280D56AA|nr:enoyl-CoA hydratase/isomerase family protein [Sphingosinicella sp. LHD-64]MDQ8755244.1 enoyl-CoA hydratase/isomerase family protein [Sphingosinicella sp. LHD-64]